MFSVDESDTTRSSVENFVFLLRSTVFLLDNRQDNETIPNRILQELSEFDLFNGIV
jgi:hypothetical protein